MGNDLRATLLEQFRFQPLDKKLVIPSDTVTIVPFHDRTEALYLLALLNSIPLRAAVYSYSPSGRGLGTPAILKDLRIAQFRSNEPLHQSISAIGEKLIGLHSVDRKVVSTAVTAEESLNELAGRYWQLNPAEMIAMREAVESRELGPSGDHSADEEDIHSRMFDIGTSSEG
jgi:hypothetical protein